MDKETIQRILGIKVRLRRQELALTYQQLSERSGITISYLSDIEKGKKSASTDKIIKLAEALECDYAELISPRGPKKMQPLFDLLESDFVANLPLERFGIELADLVDVFSKHPDRVSAFLGTLLKIVRNYHLSRENLFNTALRSFQDLNNNYFPDLEEAVRVCRRRFGLPSDPGALQTAVLEAVLNNAFGIEVDREALKQNPELKGLRSYFSSKNKRFYLNGGLTPTQENFLFGRELAFQMLALQPRPFESTVQEAYSFDLLFNNFRASYFASALILDEAELVNDLKTLFQEVRFQPEKWLALLNRYNVTPETLAQRLTNILPAHFGIADLFFIRINGNNSLTDFRMTKELHLSGQQSPYATEADQHYCRRWVSIGILRQLRSTMSVQQTIIADAQISHYYDTDRSYFCLSIAKPNPQAPGEGVSVTLGLLINDHLRRTVHFIDDDNIRHKNVHTTCEQCAISDCGARAAAPIDVERAVRKQNIRAALSRL